MCNGADKLMHHFDDKDWYAEIERVLYHQPQKMDACLMRETAQDTKIISRTPVLVRGVRECGVQVQM